MAIRIFKLFTDLLDAPAANAGTYLRWGASGKLENGDPLAGLAPKRWTVLVGSIGKPAAGDVLARILVDRPVTFAANGDITGTARIAASTGCAITLKRNGEALGDWAWGAGSTAATSTISGSVAAGDVLSIEVAVADDTLEDPSLVLKGAW